jgi:hypothetical protein
MGIPRTIVRPKPEDGKPGNERVEYQVPALTTDEAWKKANEIMKERGRGRGKEGRRIQALLRTRMMCPGCGKAMSVLRRKGRVYYYCRERYMPWAKHPCMYNKFVPGIWDDEIWEALCEMLEDDVWVEAQLERESNRNEHLERMIQLERWKLNQTRRKIAKVEEGYDGGFYTLEEAKTKKRKYGKSLDAAESEIRRLEEQAGSGDLSSEDIKALRENLRRLRDRNLQEATFQEREELVARLGIRVYPSHDLRSRRVQCRMDLVGAGTSNREMVFAKSASVPPIIVYR